jgi:hypothetical protein
MQDLWLLDAPLSRGMTSPSVGRSSALRALSLSYVTLAVVLLAAGAQARAADPLEPGLWKVVTRVEMNGMQAPAEAKMRCLTPDDARDLERTFAPEYRVQGSTCERMTVEWTGQKLSWRVHCTGPLSVDVAGSYEFDTPRHYTGVVTMVGAMAGREMRTRAALEGERVGECGSEDGSQKPEAGNRKPEDKK